jgi:hypothetical protein
LDISKSAFPLLIGKYAFSDEGNYLNDGFLGDYEHNQGEQLGDVILVAGAYYGNGKVLVFGDTSLFQNVANSQSYQLVNNAFKWLNNNQNFNVIVYQLISFLILVIVILVAMLFFRVKLFSILIPIIVCIGIILSSTINPAVVGEITIEGSTFYIDASHGERINFQYYRDDSIDGLILNLARNNYTSYFLYEFSNDKIKSCEGLVLVAPTMSFSNGELTFLKEYISGGGLVILSVGYQDKESSQNLLNEFDLDIQNIPLGPIPLDETDENIPKFVDAWPITYEKNNDTESFYNVTVNNVTYDLIILKRYGEGGLLLIADSQFLLDENLESLYSYEEANINFLKAIIEGLKDREVLR